MKRFKRRTDRPDPARRGPSSGLESLETRELLTGGSGVPAYSVPYYQPTTLLPRTVDHSSPILSVAHPIATSSPQQLARLEGQGKLLTGKDRQGNEWQITVHGPGSVIVTDATPNDGVFDDDLDTIQLVGTSLTQTYVTGEVAASARLTTGGTVLFDHLIAQNGVKSIILNGFTLARTVSVSTTGVPEVFLPGGVQYLSFQNIQAPLDLSTNPPPFNIIIGDPSTPSTVAPTIKLGSIQNTVFNSNVTSSNGTPQTNPSVNLIVNGQLRGLDIVSATQSPLANAAQQQEFPIVATTGRTSIQARGVGHLKVAGSAVNTTVSRTPQPFQHGFSGVDHITTAEFGGTADAVGIDATNGTIKHLRFLRGLGNPAGSSTAATGYGTPQATAGYPSFGLSGGTVVAKHIGRLTVGAANLTRQTPSDPDLQQIRRQGSQVYFTRPGNALTNAAIVASKSIDRVHIVGNTQASEIRSGYHYPSYIAGLEPVRAASKIRKVRQNGSAVDSVVAASYRPVDGKFGNGNDIAGPGLITGKLSGVLATAGETTTLGDTGTGFFAQTKVGYLPPPSAPTTTASGVLLPQQSNKTPNVLLRP